jgi:Zinc dependent phospholipase C
MPGPLTYSAIALLARDRLQQIGRMLGAKDLAGSATELELHVLQLARQAGAMMTATQPVIDPPARLYGPPLTDSVSRFALLGAIGPDLPRYAAYFVEGKDWLFDTLHKGTPDEHREKVLVGSTTLVFDFWERVGPLIDAEFSSTDERKAAKDKMRAYVLGHLCHVAADVLSHPYFESIEARLADAAAAPPVRRMSRGDVAGAFDVRMAHDFFRRTNDTRNSKWADWFPDPGELPDAFATAMAGAITGLYGARAEGLPAFEDAFRQLDPAPPPLSPGLVEEGVEYFRHIMDIERIWTLGHWLAATLAMFLPTAFAPLVARVLPLGKDLSRELTPADGPDAAAQRDYESIAFPLALTPLGPLVTMCIVSATGRGLRVEGVTGWIQAAVSLAASVGFFASLGGAGAARWTLWFFVPMGLALLQIVFVLLRGARENSRKLLWLAPLVQICLSLFTMLLYRAWQHEGVEEFEKDPEHRDKATAFGDLFAWIVIVGALWFLHAVLWRWWFSGHVPDDQAAFSPREPRQFLQLYEDVSLPHDIAAPFESDRLADLVYPPERRPILKLFYVAVGANALTLRIDHDRLTFQWTIPAAIPPRVVFAPTPAMTVDQYGQLLAKSVTGDASLGTLHVLPFRDDEKGMELSPGAVFSDPGDVKDKLTDHDTDAALFLPIKATEAEAFVLYHTPRPRLAERMGRSGMAVDGKRGAAASAAGSTLAQAVDGAGVAIPRQYHASNDGAGHSPLLRRLFRPGDTIEVATGTANMERRVVERVLGDADLVVSSAFTNPPGAGVAYQRNAVDRGARLRITTTVRVPPPQAGVGPNDLLGVVPTPFGSELMRGDVVEIITTPVARRVVVDVRDQVNIGTPSAPANLLELDAPPPVITGGVAFLDRVADADADGFPYVADADDVFGTGEAVMNDAADFAALLCLGAASRIAPPDAPAVPDGATKPVHRVYEVFRNWNLDRRRLNEWAMIVGGGAASELREGPRIAAESVVVPHADDYSGETDAFLARRMEGEATARGMGWLPAFRAWIDAASRPGQDMTDERVFRPGLPTNRALGRAVGYLLDAREGVLP